MFRRFGDRGSLLRAVYDARLTDLRTAIYSGAPHYVAMHQLLVQLLADVVGPADATWTAYALLAATRIDLVDFLGTEQVSRQQLRDDLRRYVARVCYSQ